jgi:hypothetical protein
MAAAAREIKPTPSRFSTGRVCYACAADVTGLLHQLWCCAISWVVVIAVVEITKPFSGRLRPDFLARCQPRELANATATGDIFSSTLGSGLSEATLGPVHLGQVVSECTNPSVDTVKQGRFRCVSSWMLLMDAAQLSTGLCCQHACGRNGVFAYQLPVQHSAHLMTCSS